MRLKKTLSTFAIFLAAALMLTAGAPGQVAGNHWVSAWGAAPLAQMQLQIPGMPPIPVYENQTVRMIIRPTIGGERLRIRVSNAFGATALKIGAAHVALIDKGSKIVPDSDRTLTFGGQKTISIPPGAPMLSDPVDLKVPAFAELAISIFLPEKASPETWHQTGQREIYVGGPGDLTGQTEIPDATTIHAWFWLAGLEFWSSKDAATIVTFGDSITDGFGAPPGEYRDWPDQLAGRLAGSKGAGNLAVTNEGIGGNRILHDGMGVSALARFDRDVLSLPGVADVILLEGINDVGWPHMTLPKGMDSSKFKLPDFALEDVSATDLIVGMRQMIERAHERGVRIFGATILPFEGANYYSESGEATRQAVNQWIRTGGAFDGVIDFDAAVRDPAHPAQIRQDLQSGDHLHPNAAGYKAMADAIDISALKHRN
jgi:lysophospholipase L1-like esterase